MGDDIALEINDSESLERYYPDAQTGGNMTGTMGEILEQFNFYNSEQIYFLIVVLLMTTLGNTALIMVLWRSNPENRSKMDYFLMHLAVADILVGLLSMSTELSYKVTWQWKAGWYCCKAVRYTQHMAIFASSYILVGLCIERLDSILRPARLYTKDFVAKLLVIFAWVFSFMMAVPFGILNDIGYSTHANNVTLPQCGIHLTTTNQWKVYVTLFSTFVFFLPAFIIICCYIAILPLVWGRKTIMYKPSPSVKVTQANCGTRSAELVAQPVGQTNNRNIMPLVQIRSVKISLLVVIAFLVCLFPVYLHELADVYGDSTLQSVSQGKVNWAVFIQNFQYLHYAFNPLIYAAFHTKFTSKICHTVVQMFRPSSKKGYKLQAMPVPTTDPSSPVSRRNMLLGNSSSDLLGSNRSVCTTTLDAPSEVSKSTPPPNGKSSKFPRSSFASSTTSSVELTPWRGSATESDILCSISDTGERNVKC